jgi:hypothetical protein
VNYNLNNLQQRVLLYVLGAKKRILAYLGALVINCAAYI